MNGSDLHARLKSLFEGNRAITQLIFKLSKFNPAAAAAAADDDAAGEAAGESRVELGAEIHQSLRSLEEEFELVKQEAEDITSNGNWGTSARRKESDRDRERVAIVTQVERLGEDLKLSRAQFRKAQLQAKRNEDAAKKKEREQLFAEAQEGHRGFVGRKRGQEKLSQDELLVNASEDVTSALRRTHQLMQSELERSQFAHETLQRSTAALNSLNENYSALDSLLSSSKSLITTLVSSSKSDTWYLETALYILLATIGWLVFRRIFYGPIRYLIYLPLKWSLNLFLYFTNIVVSIFAGSSAAAAAAASSGGGAGGVSFSSSTSLKVMPSATGKAPARDPDIPQGMNVGAGGPKGQRGPASMSERVGQMTDETRRREQEQGYHQQAIDNNAAGRGGEGGTVLRERAPDERPNPKKRMMEEEPPQQAASGGEEGGRSRDEL